MLEVATQSGESDFTDTLKAIQKNVDSFINGYVADLKSASQMPQEKKLTEAMAYSLTSGGQRFRPALCWLTAEALGQDPQKVLPYGVAVEFIHSYSLIHDDLPCMDDDDFRRGRPSNHKVFGEALAVLAGDALCTEAFQLLARFYSNQPALGMDLIRDLSKAAGPSGLAGGQAIDLEVRGLDMNQASLEKLHALKTGRLFETCVSGSARICGANNEQMYLLLKYSQLMGLTFQIADDLSDGNQMTDEPSFVRTVGEATARLRCTNLIEEACETLKPLGASARGLEQLVRYVYARTK